MLRVVCVGRVLEVSHPLPSDYLSLRRLFVAKRHEATPLHLQASTLQPSPSAWLGRTETRRTRACTCSRLLRLFRCLRPLGGLWVGRRRLWSPRAPWGLVERQSVVCLFTIGKLPLTRLGMTA